MPRNLILPILAVISFSYMIWHVTSSTKSLSAVEPVTPPARAAFKQVIAGSGVIEPQSENIRVAAIAPGVVTAVHVKVGQLVEADTPLFQLDERQRQAELIVAHSQLAQAQAELHRWERFPRAEDLPPSAARVNKAAAELKSLQDQLSRAEELVAKRIWTEQELIQREQAFLAAKAALAQAEAEDVKLKAGAWEEDLLIARAQVERSQALVQQAQVELDRLQVKSPIRGTILKVDVRPGEYVGTPPGKTLLVIGDLDRLHVRVDIDEQDLPRFRPGLVGQGFVRGDADQPLELTFVRVDPFAEPKQSLTNAGNERVDTRVLQVIYAIESPPATVYVGQQIDVFLDTSAGKNN